MKNIAAKIAPEAARLLRTNAVVELRHLISALRPADLARLVERLGPEAGAAVFALASDRVTPKALEEMDVPAQRGIVEHTTPERLAPIIRQMPDDDVVALLGVLNQQQTTRLRAIISQEAAEGIARLLSYPKGSAGRLMTDRFVTVQGEMTARQAIDLVRPLVKDAATANYIYVLDQEGLLRGVLSLRELVAAPPDQAISEITTRDLITVAPFETGTAVVRIAMDYDLLALPVVDGQGALMGVVTIDDLFDVLDETSARSLQGVVGGHGMAVGNAVSPWLRLRQRLPWLVLLMFGDFLSANVIQQFEHVLQTVVAVAFFVPILLDMAGNVGTQSLAITIRGMATQRIGPRDFGRIVGREALTGLLLGLACGGIVALLALVWQGSPILGLIVGGAMLTGLTLAAVLGVVIPVILDRFGFDAAIGSSPLITTAADVSALMVYFLLARQWLDRLA